MSHVTLDRLCSVLDVFRYAEVNQLQNEVGRLEVLVYSTCTIQTTQVLPLLSTKTKDFKTLKMITLMMTLMMNTYAK